MAIRDKLKITLPGARERPSICPNDRSAASATERASFGSFLFTAPAASSRTRAARLGCTSSTFSPAATSCWASRCPRPPALSTAQDRSGQATAHLFNTGPVALTIFSLLALYDTRSCRRASVRFTASLVRLSDAVVSRITGIR